MSRHLSCKTCWAIAIVAISGMSARGETPAPDPAIDQAAFEQAAAGTWQEVFSDPYTGDWKERWHLDGGIGTVATPFFRRPVRPPALPTAINPKANSLQQTALARAARWIDAMGKVKS